MLHVFIINSFAGMGNFSDSVRDTLSTIENLNYLVFNSEYEGHEGEIARQICGLFPEEHIRFYACGGSGTFRNMMSGIDDYDRCELAEIPYGQSNDFLAMFGDNKEKFLDIKAMTEGYTVNLDYISTNAGVAHNTVSCGFDARMATKFNSLKNLTMIGGTPKYIFSALNSYFAESTFKGTLYLDGQRVKGRFFEVIISNGRIFGSFMHTGIDNDIQDGLLNVILVPKKHAIDKLMAFMAMLFDRERLMKKYCVMKTCKSFSLVFDSNAKNNFGCDFDGEVRTDVTEINGSVVKKGLKFVIPKGLEVPYAK